MGIFPLLAEYLVKELFGPTIQGEGVHAGRACVFLRLAVCNLACSWCDTDFSPEGASRMSATAIAERLTELDSAGTRMVVVTGGEPSLQWDQGLARALATAGFSVHMESNGTRELRAPVDWLTVSPKPQFHDGRHHLAEAVLLAADECKVVVDDSVDEPTLDDFQRRFRADHLLLQPCMDGDYQRSLERCLALQRARPDWRLSLQLHKIVGLP